MIRGRTKRKKMSPLLCCFVLSLTVFTCVLGDDSSADFTDTTNQVFKDVPVDGIIAAYGDFDSDKLTDIFVLRENGHTVDLYFLEVGETTDTVTLSKKKHTGNLSIYRQNDTITSVVPGDFDGDSQMDTLITTKPNGKVFDKSALTSAFVYWGQNGVYDLGTTTTVSTQMRDQPLMMDYDANMIPDLFGEDKDGQRQFWFCNNTKDHIFTSVPVSGNHVPLRIPNANSFLDLTDNLNADLLVTSETGFELWEHLPSEPGAPQVWRQSYNYSLPIKKAAHIGQSSFVDMDADGILDHILPVCLDKECRNSVIYLRRGSTKQWSIYLDLKTMDSHKAWGFIPPKHPWAYIPITLRIGDTNMDSYPDIICILRSEANSETCSSGHLYKEASCLKWPHSQTSLYTDKWSTRQIIVLENVEGKTLKGVWNIKALKDIHMPILATHMDLTHTGILDILVVNQSTPEQKPEIHVLKNNFAVDAYFFKAHVLSGLCFESCDGLSTKPYGVNQPGPFVHYTTTSSTGAPQLGAAAQLYQSAYLSLQLPYVILGLGQNPNYVDYLTVTVPSATQASTKNVRQHTFSSIIPNSQLIAIPVPLEKPLEWRSVLIITPGRSVLVTGGVLVGSCVFMVIIVGVLQLLEKREDDKEKRQESHRFHFDAM